jgi:hypothetical protein
MRSKLEKAVDLINLYFVYGEYYEEKMFTFIEENFELRACEKQSDIGIIKEHCETKHKTIVGDDDDLNPFQFIKMKFDRNRGTAQRESYAVEQEFKFWYVPKGENNDKK